jgi:tryptophan-rich sensory protein
MQAQPLSRGASAGLLVGLLVVCFGVAALGGVSTADAVREWYPTLDKPPWTPPNWAFGPIWTFLYASMAVAAWDVIRRGPAPARGATGLFAVQLVFNALWSPVFFAWHQVLPALVIITLLWACIAGCIATFWARSRLAGALMVPYLVWISVAWSLNAWIWWFND